MSNDDIIIPELLPPSEDGVFRTLLTHADAKPILRDVVESYLHFPVVKVEVRNAELPISDINEKRERFDVNCTVNDGSQFELEMQSEAMSGDSMKTNHEIIKGRAVYNLCDLHSSQEGRNIRYDKLLRSYQMTLCGYPVFHSGDKYIRRFKFRDEDGNVLSDAVGIIVVELTKLTDVITKQVETMTGEEMWSVFFAHASDPQFKDLIDKLMAAKEEIKMAVELLKRFGEAPIDSTTSRAVVIYTPRRSPPSRPFPAPFPRQA